MQLNKFQPDMWLQKEEKHIATPVTAAIDSSDDIEIITQRIEAAGIDITAGYENWRDLGFALSDQLGENGRDYFHRLSRFNPDYDQTECDKQYDKCLRAQGTGITIKTLFQKAKDAGISLRTKSAISAESAKSAHTHNVDSTKQKSAVHSIAEIAETVDSADFEEVPLPTFSDKVKDQLPDILKRIATKSLNEQDSDILILGALTVFSACLPHICGIYAERYVYPNLFLFVTAEASSGKGRLSLCRSLVEPIHNRLRQINEAEMMEYKQKLAEFKAAKKPQQTLMEQPEVPPMRMLFIPANSSATAVYQVLNDNGGKGLMFETEGDTLANTFSSDYGNYSDGFRKAFHHETISYIRRKDREYVDIKRPRLSTLLTGTPHQILNLITDAENGLFSRFAFYRMKQAIVWNNVFEKNTDSTLDEYFKNLGEEFNDLNNILDNKSSDIIFGLSDAQQVQFNSKFDSYQTEYLGKCGNEFIASVRRLGLITFRIAMILSTLRIMEDGDAESNRICSEEDFGTSMTIADVLLEHNAKVFLDLPASPTKMKAKAVRNTQLNSFFDELPDEFERQVYVQLAESKGLVAKSIDRVIKRWCDEGKLENIAHGKYKKV